MVEWAWQYKVEIWLVLTAIYMLLSILNMVERPIPAEPPTGHVIKENHTASVAVSPAYFWEPIETVPLGCKVQLKTIPGGIATYGEVNERNRKYFSAWAPLPTTRKDRK